MFSLNEKRVVSDITVALKNEAGIFFISAPTGESLRIRLEKGNVEVYLPDYVSDMMRNDELWTVVKIGELG